MVQALVAGRFEEWLRGELADRYELRYPPTVRVASVTGGVIEVQRALEGLEGLTGVDTLGPTAMEAAPGDGPLVRAIVRFDYSVGAEVARRLRASLVADAAGSSSRVAGRGQRRQRTGSLRLRFDDRAVFDD